MGQIAGVFGFDSQPVSEEHERWLRTPLDPPAASSTRFWQGPSLIMSDAGEGTSPGERFVSLEGAVCCWEGRLHNRRELAGTADSAGAIALKLYQARRVPGFGDLVGDWSLALWDPASRSIILASDYAGIRPLYYCRGAHSVLWSSSLAHLARHAATQGIDEEYAASFLRRGKASYRTPYRGIYPVPPGQAVRISADGVSTEAFWQLPFGREVRLRDEREYEEQLRHLFEEAVRVRLPETSPVCAELSGGLDSSSVVCMASRILHDKAGQPARPLTFSYLQTGSTDEKYISAVEDALGSPGIHLNLEEYPFLTANDAGDGYPALSAPRHRELARRIAAVGSDVLLTGQFGDFIMGGAFDDSDQVVGYLERGLLFATLREAMAWSRTLHLPIYTILWRALRTALTSWAPEPERGDFRTLSPYATTDSLSPEFRRRVSLEEIERSQERRWLPARPSQRRRFRSFTESQEARALQAPEPVQHLSFTHPFAHRPLVEFMLTIPPGQVCRPGEPRRLMRRAFTGLLPPAIVRRKSKMTYSAMYRQALIPLAAELLKRPGDMRLVQAGYIDRENVTQRLTRLTQGLDCNETQLRHVILPEFWMRNRGAAVGG